MGPLVVPTLLIGPDATGRNYSVLRRSPELDLSPAARAMLADFALALAGWADRPRPEFVAHFGLGDGTAALVRGRYLGEGSRGTIAAAAVLVLDTPALAALSGGAERLLHALPSPDDPTIGLEPVTVDVPPLTTARGPLGRLGLAWRDCALEVAAADQAEATLIAALSAIEPVEQRLRLNGWSTTASLPTAGGFVPASAFSLIVHAPDETFHLRALPHAPLTWRADNLSGGVDTVPDVRRAWLAVKDLPVNGPERAALDALTWKVPAAGAEATGIVALALVEACVGLQPDAQMRLLQAVTAAADHAGDLGAPLTGGLGQALGLVLGSANTTPQLQVYAQRLVAWPQPAVTAVRDGVLKAFARPALTAALDRQTLDRLFGLGLLSTLAEIVAPADLRDVALPSLKGLLDAALANATKDPAARRLAVVGLAAFAEAAPLDAQGVQLCRDALRKLLLKTQPSRSDQDLAVPGLAEIVGVDAELFVVYAARVIAPTLDGATLRDVVGLSAALSVERARRSR